MLLLLWRLLLALLDGFRQIYVLQVEKAVTSLLEFYKVYQYSEFYVSRSHIWLDLFIQKFSEIVI